ncbi:MAG: hypothetical protein ACOYYS_03765 [Chloroflexota bacterium]
MNITRKGTPDPATAIKNHDGGMLWALKAAEEVAGKPGLAVVLKQAGLEHIIDNYPEDPNQVTGKCTLGEYADLNAGLLNFFGRAGCSMVLRIGRLSQQKGMEKFNNAFGAAAIGALRLLPKGMRAQKRLEVVKVKEVECRAMGAPACVWEINKLPARE